MNAGLVYRSIALTIMTSQSIASLAIYGSNYQSLDTHIEHIVPTCRNKLSTLDLWLVFDNDGTIQYRSQRSSSLLKTLLEDIDSLKTLKPRFLPCLSEAEYERLV